MYKVYDAWPQIAKNSYNSDLEESSFDKIEHIVFAGMGGSGAISDIFSSILSKTNIHVSIVKGYHLPKTVDTKTLLVTSSISGNTIETITVLDLAREKGCKTISFSAGGKMMKYCSKHQLDYRKIPMYHSPRASFTSFLYSMLKVLSPIVKVEKDDVSESINQMLNLQKEISSERLEPTNPSLMLAEWITNIPIIYYPWGLQAAAIRFKNSLQENAKQHAMAEDVVEACHNGIVAWGKESTIKPILIQGHDDYVKTKETWEIFKDYFEKKEIEYKEVFSVKGSILSKLINLIYMLDFSTIYLAVKNKIDPTPVDAIDFIKERL
jgi:glucose/mannose-6-phosphate isomerase